MEQEITIEMGCGCKVTAPLLLENEKIVFGVGRFNELCSVHNPHSGVSMPPTPVLLGTIVDESRDYFKRFGDMEESFNKGRLSFLKGEEYDQLD